MSTPIPCFLNVPEAFQGPAAYALEMLLLPLDLHPRWVSEPPIQGITYSTAPHADRWGLTFICHEETLAYFSRRTPRDPASVLRLTDERGYTWPVPFRDGDNPERPDPIASTFFFLSDWDAWTRRSRDHHGRFCYTHSLWKALNLPPLPVVDFLREQLLPSLHRLGYPVTPRRWGTSSWALAPTHDIDYLRKWRPGIFFRELVEYPLLRRNVPLSRRWRRLRSFLGELATLRDPYTEGIHRMIGMEKSLGVSATYFFKAGAHGPRDVNYALRSHRARRIFRNLQDAGSEIALHPSYFACAHEGYLRQEHAYLTSAVGCAPLSSRQHYLRWYPQTTPRLLADTGVRWDSTLAFPDHEGFRNGTCFPFRIFDPVDQRPLPLWEVPLAVMDSTLFHYRGLDPEEGVEQTLHWMALVERFGGVLVMLWHEILFDRQDYPGWPHHMEALLQEALHRKARVDALQRLLTDWLPSPA